MVVVVVAVFIVVAVVSVVVVVAAVAIHTVDDIDPEEDRNIWYFVAFEFTQETPHNIWLKDFAPLNISLMSVTADTSHADRSWLKECAL